MSRVKICTECEQEVLTWWQEAGVYLLMIGILTVVSVCSYKLGELRGTANPLPTVPIERAECGDHLDAAHALYQKADDLLTKAEQAACRHQA